MTVLQVLDVIFAAIALLAVVRAEVHYTGSDKKCLTPCYRPNNVTSYRCYYKDDGYWWQSSCSPSRNYTIFGEPCRPDHECSKHDRTYCWCYTGETSFQSCTPVGEGDPSNITLPMFVISYGTPVDYPKLSNISEVYDNRCHNFDHPPEEVRANYACVKLWQHKNCQGESLTLYSDYAKTDRYSHDYPYLIGNCEGMEYVNSYSSCDANITQASIMTNSAGVTIQLHSNECMNLGQYTKGIISVSSEKGCITMWKNDDCQGASLDVLGSHIIGCGNPGSKWDDVNCVISGNVRRQIPESISACNFVKNDNSRFSDRCNSTKHAAACAGAGDFCSDSLNCCSKRCKNSTCSQSKMGSFCYADSDCYRGWCNNIMCMCSPERCSTDKDCCGGHCKSGECSCAETNDQCTANADCCTDQCTNGICTCTPDGGKCDGVTSVDTSGPDSSCCSDWCNEGKCGSSDLGSFASSFNP